MGEEIICVSAHIFLRPRIFFKKSAKLATFEKLEKEFRKIIIQKIEIRKIFVPRL